VAISRRGSLHGRRASPFQSLRPAVQATVAKAVEKKNTVGTSFHRLGSVGGRRKVPTQTLCRRLAQGGEKERFTSLTLGKAFSSPLVTS